MLEDSCVLIIGGVIQNKLACNEQPLHCAAGSRQHVTATDIPQSWTTMRALCFLTASEKKFLSDEITKEGKI